MSGTTKTAGALSRALREAPALRRGLGLTLLLAVVGTSLQLVVPILIQQMVDKEILAPTGVDVGGSVAKGAAALVAVLAALLAARASLIRLIVAATTGLSDLRVKTFNHIHRLSVLHVEAERRGALVARVTSDVDTIEHFMEWGGAGMIIGSSQVLLAIAVMLVYQWQLALLVIASVVVYAVLLLWFQRILRRAHDRVRLRVADSLAASGEAISGLPVVRAYGIEQQTMDRVRNSLDAQADAEFRAGALGAVLFSSADLYAGTITAAVIAFGLVTGVSTGMSAGTLLAFLFLLILLVEPVQLLVETLDAAQTAGAGMRRIISVIDTPTDVPDPVDGEALPPGELAVRFAGVRFRYPTGGDVLHDVDVEIEPGRRVAVVGETGSGKTTFAKLLTRLLDPTEGRVLLGGVPIDRVPFADLRSRVAFVPQEGFLFDATVGDNVRYGLPAATDEEVATALADLGLERWLAGLPAGLHTPVGERGSNLSAGERQLVALARAWIADPGVLVLDEATSAVDPALEVQLRRAIERLTFGRTSITVAHRLSTAEAADEVLVFAAGRLVERGSHAELLALGGEYARLHADWAAGAER